MPTQLQQRDADQRAIDSRHAGPAAAALPAWRCRATVQVAHRPSHRRQRRPRPAVADGREDPTEDESPDRDPAGGNLQPRNAWRHRRAGQRAGPVPGERGTARGRQIFRGATTTAILSGQPDPTNHHAKRLQLARQVGDSQQNNGRRAADNCAGCRRPAISSRAATTSSATQRQGPPRSPTQLGSSGRYANDTYPAAPALPARPTATHGTARRRVQLGDRGRPGTPRPWP